MRMTLQRVSVRREGAFGVLLNERMIPFAVTLERTYDELDESGEVSTKIAPGVYKCSRSYFNRGGYPTYEIEVPGHSRILFHKGNVENDADGCVLVASSFGELRGEDAIIASAAGFAEFMRRASNYNAFELEVRQ